MRDALLLPMHLETYRGRDATVLPTEDADATACGCPAPERLVGLLDGPDAWLPDADAPCRDPAPLVLRLLVCRAAAHDACRPADVLLLVGDDAAVIVVPAAAAAIGNATAAAAAVLAPVARALCALLSPDVPCDGTKLRPTTHRLRARRIAAVLHDARRHLQAICSDAGEHGADDAVTASVLRRVRHVRCGCRRYIVVAG